jgi:hypothetical protein
LAKGGESSENARGRTRTGTGFPPRDFKSLASTNFATRATARRAILQK